MLISNNCNFFELKCAICKLMCRLLINHESSRELPDYRTCIIEGQFSAVVVLISHATSSEFWLSIVCCDNIISLTFSNCLPTQRTKLWYFPDSKHNNSQVCYFVFDHTKQEHCLQLHSILSALPTLLFGKQQTRRGCSLFCYGCVFFLSVYIAPMFVSVSEHCVYAVRIVIIESLVLCFWVELSRPTYS